MEKKGNHLIYRILVAILGMCISGVGIGLSLYANLGVDPASVMETGFARVVGVSYGTSAAIINVLILAIVLFVDRSYVNISSLLAIFFIGYVADGMTWVLNLLCAAGLSIVVRVLFILAGNLLIGLGVAVYTAPQLGVGAIDLVSQIISDKSKFVYRWVRVVCDLLFLAIGWALGGSVGVGTVVSALMVGPAVQFARPFVHKVTDKIPGCAQAKA